MPVKVKAPKETETTVKMPGMTHHHNLTHVKPPKKPHTTWKIIFCIIIILICLGILIATVINRTPR